MAVHAEDRVGVLAGEPRQASDLFFRPLPKLGNHAEVRLEEGEIDLSFYEGDGVALRDGVRDFIIVNQPMQHLCQPECKGLCPHCGANRNTTECNCAEQYVNPRLAALRKL